MIKLESPLTKENFWDDLYKRYPEGTKIFCDWIDEYKKTVNWLDLFNYGVAHYASKLHDPKFHDLPHAFQLGIWMAFVTDRGGCHYEIENFFEFDLSEEITAYVKEVLQPEAELANG